MPTMTELACLLLAVSILVGFYAFLKSIHSRHERREMGVRLHGDDE